MILETFFRTRNLPDKNYPCVCPFSNASCCVYQIQLPNKRTRIWLFAGKIELFFVDLMLHMNLLMTVGINKPEN